MTMKSEARTILSKTNTYRTKKKQQREANASDADKLINEFLYEGSGLGRAKTRRILEEYVDDTPETGGAIESPRN